MEGAVPRGPGRWALPSVTHTFNSDTVALSLHTFPHPQFTLFAKLSWDPRGSAHSGSAGDSRTTSPPSTTPHSSQNFAVVLSLAEEVLLL